MDEQAKISILVIGCGNTLLGDDGFGPAVADCLVSKYTLPGHVRVIDAGTAISDILFDILLMPCKPRDVYIIDSVLFDGVEKGQLMEISPQDICPEKSSDYSLHQFPSVNLLREINSDTGVGIHILAVQAGYIPDFIKPGLSPEVEYAIEPACSWLLNQIERSYNG